MHQITNNENRYHLRLLLDFNAKRAKAITYRNNWHGLSKL